MARNEEPVPLSPLGHPGSLEVEVEARSDICHSASDGSATGGNAARILEEQLRYRFPKSTSKRFGDALEFAQGLQGFHKDGNDHWIEIPDGEVPSAEFRELERISQNWKGAGHFIGEKRVTHATWWNAANPFAKFAKANVPANWLSSKEWQHWGKPQNLVVGESYRQSGLRSLAGVDEETMTLQPLEVTLEREPHNRSDPYAVKAVVSGVHIGYLSADRAAVISPAMEKGGISVMKVAGVLSGRDSLGVHIWPDRLLSTGIMVGDPNRPVEARYHDSPRRVYEDYLEAKRSYRPGNLVQTPTSVASSRVETYTPTPEEVANTDRALTSCEVANTDRALTSCATGLAWIFGIVVFLFLLLLVAML